MSAETIVARIRRLDAARDAVAFLVVSVAYPAAFLYGGATVRAIAGCVA